MLCGDFTVDRSEGASERLWDYAGVKSAIKCWCYAQHQHSTNPCDGNIGERPIISQYAHELYELSASLGSVRIHPAALGEEVRHRTNPYSNNHLEQDHRGIKQRSRPMGGFKSVESAKRFCRVHDEVRNFLHPRTYRNEFISPSQRRRLFIARTRALLTSLVAAKIEHQVTLLSYLLAVGATFDTTLPAE